MTDEEPLGFLQSEDGTWSVVGPDGWPVEIPSYGNFLPLPSLPQVHAFPIFHATPIHVMDHEYKQGGLDAAE